MNKFKIGDKVIINKETFNKIDPLHLGRARGMFEACQQNKVLTITYAVETYNLMGKKVVYYRCNDDCVYNKEWLLLAEPEIPYHKDPKINAVIVKIKQLENKRKEKGYAY